MPRLTFSRRGRLAAAVVPLAAIAAAAGAALPAAQAAGRTAASPGLHVTGTVTLGPSTGILSDAFALAPNGSLFYSVGSVVYVVAGNAKPGIALHAGGKVMALAASQSDLFVQTGLTITEYTRSSGTQVRRWTVSSPVKPITSAGLVVAGGTLWSWTDWATDSSGFEYATVSRIATSASAVRVVTKSAYPGDMSADSTGLYFEAQNGSSGDLGHATPSGKVSYSKLSATDSPVALTGGRVDLLAFGASKVTINTYSETKLSLLTSKKVSSGDRWIAGSRLGLLVLGQTCGKYSCGTVSILNAATGAASGTARVPGAYFVFGGASAAVIGVSGKNMVLERVGA